MNDVAKIRCIIGCLVGLMGGCRTAATREPPSEPGARLIAAHDALYIRHPPDGAKRGDLFVVSSHQTIPGTSDRARVGLVEGKHRHQSSLEVVELCALPAGELTVLGHGGGLPAAPLQEDTSPRVGKCMTRFTLHPREWDPGRSVVDLRLEVGEGDGVREGDRYVLYGDPIADSLNRTVTGFEKLGECAVQTSTSGLAFCRLSRRHWPDFDRDRAMLGGVAVLHRSAQEGRGR